MRHFLLLGVLVLTASCASFQPSTDRCLSWRGAIDMGSGSTKAKVAEVNHCEGRIARVVYDDSRKVPFLDGITPAIQKSGISAVQSLQAAGLEAASEWLTDDDTLTWSGVATEAFRKHRKSATPFLLKLLKQTGVTVQIVSQEEEARIGYLGALAHLDPDVTRPVVWDIGGGSMQISWMEKGKLHTFQGKNASVTFRDQVSAGKPTPNPMTATQQKSALTLARSLAKEIPPAARAAIRQADAVAGIGGVHGQSIRNQTGKQDGYTPSDLHAALSERVGWTDARIGHPYASTDITNLIFVLAYMEELGIEKIIPLRVNLADGVLVNEAFWMTSKSLLGPVN